MTERPNILLITTDQQRSDSLSCYGSEFTGTPNLDRLADEGVLCERAYCVNPVCTPARASMLSGRYVSRHGGWNVGMSVPDDEPLSLPPAGGAGLSHASHRQSAFPGLWRLAAAIDGDL